MAHNPTYARMLLSQMFMYVTPLISVIQLNNIFGEFETPARFISLPSRWQWAYRSLSESGNKFAYFSVATVKIIHQPLSLGRLVMISTINNSYGNNKVMLNSLFDVKTKVHFSFRLSN